MSTKKKIVEEKPKQIGQYENGTMSGYTAQFLNEKTGQFEDIPYENEPLLTATINNTTSFIMPYPACRGEVLKLARKMSFSQANALGWIFKAFKESMPEKHRTEVRIIERKISYHISVDSDVLYVYGVTPNGTNPR